MDCNSELTTEMMTLISQLVAATGAPDTWTDLIRYTRVGAMPITIGTMDTIESDDPRQAQSDWRGDAGFWQNGFRMRRIANGYLLTSHTVCYGREVMSFIAEISNDGRLSGYANAFELGFVPVDFAYIANHIEERLVDFTWDVIS